jgi:hypothetical protein
VVSSLACIQLHILYITLKSLIGVSSTLLLRPLYGSDHTPLVSRGHGLAAPDGDNANDPKNLNRIIFDHLDALFPQAAGTVLGESGRDLGKNGFVNGALGGTGESVSGIGIARRKELGHALGLEQ